jgi:hypothetical protein
MSATKLIISPAGVKIPAILEKVVDVNTETMKILDL